MATLIESRTIGCGILAARIAAWCRCLPVAACVAIAGLVGCSGETRTPAAGGSSAAAPAESDSVAQADAAVAEYDAEVAAQEAAAAEAAAADAAAQVAAQEPAEPAARPENVAQWTAEHFKSAKTENDPKLSDAVAHLDRRFRGNDQAASALAFLLTVEQPPQEAQPQPSSDGYGGYGGGYGGVASSGYGGYGGGYDGGGYGSTTAQAVQISPELAGQVVAALGRNGSKTAVAKLEELVSGKATTPLDKQTMFTEALHAMAANMRPEYETIIFRLATRPGEVIETSEPEQASDAAASSNPYGGGYGGGYGGYGSGGELTVDWVRSQMLQELEQWASTSLRVRLARYLQDPTVTQQTAEEFERLLIAEDPRNLPAQIVLFQLPEQLVSQNTRQQLQQRLAAGGQQALARLVGIESDASGYGSYGGYGGYGSGYSSGYGSGYDGGYGSGGIGPPVASRPAATDTAQAGTAQPVRPSRDGSVPTTGSGADGYGSGYGGYGTGSGVQTPAVDPEQALAQLAELLWTDAVAQKVGDMLRSVTRFDERPDLIRILATMPNDVARQNLAELFERFQDQGPSAFSTAGLLGQNVMDPAFVLVAKKAYHGRDNDDRDARTRGRGTTDGGYGGYGSGYGAAGATYATDPWEQEVESHVQFLFTALAQGESPWDPADSSGTATQSDAAPGETEAATVGPRKSMPVHLHRNAQVTAEYHARWPQHAKDRLPGATPAPLEIHYVRIEEENRPSRLAGIYKRQAGRNAIVREAADGGWIDGLVEDHETGERRSVDVRIYNAPDAAQTAANLRPNDERPMVVEILTISIPGKSLAADGPDGATSQASQVSTDDEDLPF